MLKNCLAICTPGPRARTTRHRRTLATAAAAVVESLEQRRMLTTTSSLSGTLLTVTGDTSVNAITLQTSAGNLTDRQGRRDHHQHVRRHERRLDHRQRRRRQ